MSTPSIPDDGNGSVRFSVKELLLELRRDVAAIDAKLDLKADRERVHQLASEIAAVNLFLAAERAKRDELDRETRTGLNDIDSLKTWRNRLAGGLVVVGALSGAIAAHLVGAF